MAADDLDIPPASDDDVVQGFLDTQWREAMRAAHECREAIRKIYPELTAHLPETASSNLGYALRDNEDVTRHLQLAGRHILGQDEFDAYIDARTRRQIEG